MYPVINKWFNKMPRMCQICGKTSVMESARKKLMSKYNPTPKKRKRPNLQKALIPADIKKKNFKPYAGQKVLACTKCIKTLGKD